MFRSGLVKFGRMKGRPAMSWAERTGYWDRIEATTDQYASDALGVPIMNVTAAKGKAG